MQPNEPTPLQTGDALPTPIAQPVPSSVPIDADLDQDEEPYIISWQASEYLQHDNGVLWYLAFFAVALLLIAFSIWLHLWTFIAVVVVCAIAGIIHVRRPPRVVSYELDGEGLTIDTKLRQYGEFKSFSVIRDGAFFAIMLIPIRRFSPATIVYFEQKDGEEIVDALGDRLPMENRDLDAVDRFLRLIRF